jgi:phosphoribulokinase
MSTRYPIISVTGSSGAGTTSVKRTFEQIFRREGINADYIEGDAFHRYDREEMRTVMAEEEAKGNHHFSHFGPAANLLEELEAVFASYSARGAAKTRKYVHDEAEARVYGRPPGTFTDWKPLQAHSDLLFYEGLHGAAVTDKVNIAKHADLKIGVVPVINLEWIQKIHRDKADRGYTMEAVMDTILRRMPDYTRYICPQFTETDINFQRVPTVDTSNPFTARWIPTADESMVIIRFARPAGIDFSYLLSMLRDSFMSRANSIVIPGNKLDLAMQLILTPLILQLVERRKRLTLGRKIDEHAGENF